MLFSIIDWLTCLYFLVLVAIAIVTNVWPYVELESDFLDIHIANNTNLDPNMKEVIQVSVLTNRIVIMIIGKQKWTNLKKKSCDNCSGGLGNLLTLLAIPYIRHKYGAQFSLLTRNVMVLILHLSAVDLLYILIGIPNLIEVRLRELY